ncbi:pterin-4-alpha-carbinolamine dehydratase [bacterium]|nr:pterin-4-alpha-carbinolamine dehydratase [Parcubacteria group bacterium]MBF05492.1 pterin-4-alpha-carbinolamine dehydratase [bacterium]|tara:strand:+ start:2473 stop:2757 length:285 start_codon:yes stop_codon:yes gene_type:complete
MATPDKDALRSFLMSDSVWELDAQDNTLVRTFVFRTYKEGVTFANKVTEIAEEQNHHPQIIIDWGSVTIKTTTHDEGNTITDKDVQIAQAIDAL